MIAVMNTAGRSRLGVTSKGPGRWSVCVRTVSSLRDSGFLPTVTQRWSAGLTCSAPTALHSVRKATAWFHQLLGCSHALAKRSALPFLENSCATVCRRLNGLLRRQLPCEL